MEHEAPSEMITDPSSSTSEEKCIYLSYLKEEDFEKPHDFYTQAWSGEKEGRKCVSSSLFPVQELYFSTRLAQKPWNRWVQNLPKRRKTAFFQHSSTFPDDIRLVLDWQEPRGLYDNCFSFSSLYFSSFRSEYLDGHVYFQRFDHFIFKERCLENAYKELRILNSFNPAGAIIEGRHFISASKSYSCTLCQKKGEISSWFVPE